MLALIRRLACLIFVVALTACSGGGDDASTVGSRPTPARGTATADPLSAICGRSPDDCAQVGEATVLVYRSSSPTSRGLLLWDPGGPGLTPLDEGAARQALPPWTADFDLLLIPEPWTSQNPTTSCLQASTGKVAANTCDWSALNRTPEQMTHLVDAVERGLGPIRAVLASSFGAVRSLPAMQAASASGGFIVLDSPSPPPDVSAASLLTSRSIQAEKAVLDAPECGRRCADARQRALARVSQVNPGISSSQVELAILAMSYDVAENEPFLRQLWQRNGDLTRAGRTSFRAAATAFSLRRPDGAARPELAGYLAQLCPLYRGWPTPSSTLTRMHEPCAAIPSTQAQATAAFASLVRSRPRMFIVTNRGDPVAPPSLQDRWRLAFPKASTRAFTAAAHTEIPTSINQAIARWSRR